jgi:hypothetical protein
MRHWTLEDAHKWEQYVAKLGGKVVKGQLTWNGGWAGEVRPPQDSQPGWASRELKQFCKQEGLQ